MTVNGTINKILLLLVGVFLSVGFSWIYVYSNPSMLYPFMIGGAIVGLILVLVGTFNPGAARWAAPVYAFVEGVFLGALSLFFNSMFPGLVINAIVLTILVFVTMLMLFRTGIIKVTAKLRASIIAATIAIAAAYFLNFLLSLFGVSIPMIHSAEPFGIIFNLVVVGIAAFNLLLDIDFITRGANQGINKKYEWLAALGLLVALVWLYVDLLRRWYHYQCLHLKRAKRRYISRLERIFYKK